MGARYAGIGSQHHVSALSGVAEAQLQMGDVQRAHMTARDALTVARTHLGPSHPASAGPRLALARVRAALGDTSGALALLDEADAIASAAGPSGQRIAAQSTRLRAELSRTRSPGAGTAMPAP